MRRVKGRLVFKQKVDGKEIPIRNAFLQLWDLDVIQNDYLGSGSTDINGDFDFEYDPSSAGGRWGDKPDLVLRLMDREYAYDVQGVVVSNWYVVKSFDAGDNITDDVFDFCTRRAAFWEYQSPEGEKSIAFTPRVDVIDGKTPQDQRRGRTLEQLQVGVEHLLVHTKHELIAKFSDTRPVNQKIEDDYPVKGSTREIEETSRSDAFLCDMVLNGFNPCVLKTGVQASEYYVDFRWDGLEQDSSHFAPNTTAHFRLEDDILCLEKIAIQKRMLGRNSAHARYRPAKIYTSTDPEWSRVKRLFRCNYFLFGEVTTHLTETHLNVEQYIVPMRRNLLKNPVAQILFPHFYGTTAVNLAANDILISESGLVQQCSAITPDSVQHAAALNFGTLNWKDWAPRQPLCDQHRFAKIAHIFWEVLQDYVAAFFSIHESEIRAYWHEIHRMSDELVAHALPFAPANDAAFYDTREINTVGKPHPRVAGLAVALTPITGSDQADAEGLANLRQLCAYLLYHVTFKHSWVNDLQYQMGGAVEFATLGVSDDLTSMDVLEDTVVPPAEALEHPFITYILNYTEYGYILRNEDDDMNPELIKAIIARRSDFESLNYHVRAIRSCINT